MQKMQGAMGGKPLGPNGQPSPAQIEAMRVCPFLPHTSPFCPRRQAYGAPFYETPGVAS